MPGSTSKPPRGHPPSRILGRPAGLGLGGTELSAAIRAGQQLTRLAPLRESGYRYLMQALAAQDNLAEALSIYGQLSERLRDQLGVSPSPATRQLYQQLLGAT